MYLWPQDDDYEYVEVEVTESEFAALEEELDAHFRSYDAPRSSASAPNTTVVNFELYEEVD